ncbi:MAG: hypothetical protein QM750_07310 [Rubrivivax sp.]
MQALSTLSSPLAPAPSRRLLLALALPTALSIAAAALIVACPQALAQTAAPATSPATQAPDPELAAALARFNEAGPANHAAIDDAAQRFTQLSAARPQDPVLRAYAGAATAMRAQTTWLPWRKMGYAEDGLAQIDKALAQLTAAHDAPLHRGVPAVLETRLIAATTFLALPAMFNRGERGRALLAQVQSSPLLAGSPAPFQAEVQRRAQGAAK